MIIAAFFQLFDGIQAVAVSVLRGLQDTLVPTFITLAAYWGVGLGGSWLLGIVLGLNVTGVWYAFVLSLGSAAVALTWRFRLMSGRLIQQAEARPAAQRHEPSLPAP
jgi:MATE family multidrug resistance protein